jgi:hypothetical protein
MISVSEGKSTVHKRSGDKTKVTAIVTTTTHLRIFIISFSVGFVSPF